MTESKPWRRDVTLSLLLLALLTAAAWWTRLWVLTAVPVGFLFGFLLQKGDLCGASAFSEVVLARDWRKTFGLWVAIVVSMVGFAVIAELGWVRLAPKPMFWLNYVVGGALFGTGTVLAGGCISGCLFKAGAGNLNSMAALTGMPLGIGMVEYGALNAVHRSMMTHVVTSGTGGPVTLTSVTGLPYWGLAVGFAGATAAGVLVHRARRPVPPARRSPAGSATAHRPMETVAGGTGHRPAGGARVPVLCRHRPELPAGRDPRRPPGVRAADRQSDRARLEAGAGGHRGPAATATAAPRPRRVAGVPEPARCRRRRPKPINWWLVRVVVGMVPGAWVAARLSGVARLANAIPSKRSRPSSAASS